MESFGVSLENATDVATVGFAALVDNFAEDQHLPGAEEVGRTPVEGAPVDAKAQIALTLRGKATDGGSVEGKVVPTLDQKFLVIVQHVQTAFEVAEQYCHRFNPLFVGQILQPLILNFVQGNAVLALLFRLQIQLFQFLIR